MTERAIMGRSWRLTLCFLGASTLLSPALALAAGMEYPDNGTVATGRAGANAANPDDALAFQYNPAGLAQVIQRGWHLNLDARWAAQAVKFTSATPGTSSVENSAPPFFAPAGSVSYGFGKVGPLSDLTVALGATGPSAIGKSQYPVDGAQRYALDSTDYFIAYYSAAIAAGWKRGDFSARVGFTGQLVQGQAKFIQAVWSGFGQYDQGKNQPTDTSNDSMATFSGSSGVIPSCVAGISISPIRDLDIGVSYRPRIDFDAPGTLDIKLSKTAENISAKPDSNSASLKLSLAAMLRAGVAWRVTPRVRVELDGVWEQWSSMKEIRIATHNINITSTVAKPVPLPDVVFPHNMEDTMSVRLGTDVTVIDDMLTVRAGYAFETSAVPSAFVSIDFPNWQRHIAAVGASVRIWGAWLDLAYAHHFVETQHVTNSQVMNQVSPKLSGIPESVPSVVGNGTYEAALDVFSVSLRLPFDELTTRMFSQRTRTTMEPIPELPPETPHGTPVPEPSPEPVPVVPVTPI
jgi:long-subunit fatty acid transport protein